jgi:hypothetical protein
MTIVGQQQRATRDMGKETMRLREILTDGKDFPPTDKIKKTMSKTQWQMITMIY